MRSWFWYLLGLLVLLYTAQRLSHLLSIPVFADEAIYIYWAELAAGDWRQYAFFALNDGKTPLVIWSMIPFLRWLRDPLVAGRLVSVLFGLGQLLVSVYMVGLFTKKKRYQLLAGLLVILSPGLMLTNRLALMDTAVTFLISLTFVCTYQATRAWLRALDRGSRWLACLQRQPLWSWLGWTLAAGVSWGAALWAKFSCLLLAPVLASVVIYHWSEYKRRGEDRWQAWWRLLVWQLAPLTAISLLALLIFALLRTSPAFGMLFSRGGDFLYSINDFFADSLGIFSSNFVNFTRILFNYAGAVLVLASFAMALLFACRRWQRQLTPLLLLISGLAYALPIVILGKIVYPRYYLPVLPFVIASFCVSLSLMRRRLLIFYVQVALVVWLSATGLYWSWYLHHEPASLPLLPIDREQLMNEWSAGYGIKQTYDYLEQLAAEQKLLVLTEGFVGTLPDGLQIYLWKSQQRNHIRLLGLGAPPVRNFAESLQTDNWDDYDQVLLVVNSHRLELDDGLGPYTLVQEYPRPDSQAPTLQIWRLQ